MSFKSPNSRPRVYRSSGNIATHRSRRFLSLRAWSVNHARFLEQIYEAFAGVLLRLNRFLVRNGYASIERPMIIVERGAKGLLFDCRMCGQCILSDTGMSCAMNCPKALRNGPCGGVRADGHCEVDPEMMCVWVEAWRGSQMMLENDKIFAVQPPLDQRLVGSSAWMRATAQREEVLRIKRASSL